MAETVIIIEKATHDNPMVIAVLLHQSPHFWIPTEGEIVKKLLIDSIHLQLLILNSH